MTVREQWRAWFDGYDGPFVDDAEFRGLSPTERHSLVAYIAATEAAARGLDETARGYEADDFADIDDEREKADLMQDVSAAIAALHHGARRIRAHAGEAGA